MGVLCWSSTAEDRKALEIQLLCVLRELFRKTRNRQGAEMPAMHGLIPLRIAAYLSLMFAIVSVIAASDGGQDEDDHCNDDGGGEHDDDEEHWHYTFNERPHGMGKTLYVRGSSRQFVRCCNNAGTNCNSPLPCSGDANKKTYCEAKAFCQVYGRRLCTASELKSDRLCFNNGSDCNHAAIWMQGHSATNNDTISDVICRDQFKACNTATLEHCNSVQEIKTLCPRKCQVCTCEDRGNCTLPTTLFCKLSRQLETRCAKTCGLCPVNGGWGEWSDWSTCPVTCGGADQIRGRACDNPTPEYGGENCTFDGTTETDTQRCNENKCPDLVLVWSSTLPTGNVSPSDSHCTTMKTFQNTLISKTAKSVTVKAGSSSHTCSNATVSNQIVEKFASCMNKCTTQIFSCNGQHWGVGNCVGSGEITVASSSTTTVVCQSTVGFVTIRPCVESSFNCWGGSGKTCGANSQTLSIRVVVTETTSTTPMVMNGGGGD